MTFDELVEEVFILTNRRDLVGETESAIKNATLKAHKSDFLSKDIFETGVVFDNLDFRQSFDYISFISNFRAFKYFRLAKNELDDTGEFIDIISVDETLDSYNRNRTNIAYVAGRVLEIRAQIEFKFALLGCYVFPIIRKEAYDSWVADLYPFAIIYEAARIIFKAIGKREESNGMRELVVDEYTELKLSSVLDVGY